MDIVITDVKMPGMDQFEAQERERSGLNALIGESQAVGCEDEGGDPTGGRDWSYNGAHCWGDGYGEGAGCASGRGMFCSWRGTFWLIMPAI